MLEVTGQNISLYDTNMSPEERAQLYRTMQYNLQTELDSKKQAVSLILSSVQTSFTKNRFLGTL